MLVISAVCVVSIPNGGMRTIKELPVFYITAAFSLFAYLWLIIILQIITPNVVDVWEGLITLTFPVLVYVPRRHRRRRAGFGDEERRPPSTAAAAPSCPARRPINRRTSPRCSPSNRSRSSSEEQVSRGDAAAAAAEQGLPPGGSATPSARAATRTTNRQRSGPRCSRTSTRRARGLSGGGMGAEDSDLPRE